MENSLLMNHLCFPVYTLSKSIINLYRPHLDRLDLTYPQYLVLLVLWEEKSQTVNQLGEKLWLDSGTLTPLLKRMEQKNYLSRTRSKTDERVVNIELTDMGWELQEKCRELPETIKKELEIAEEDYHQLKTAVDKLLKKFPLK